MGEHTDYNEGLVLPLALERTVTVEVTRDGAPPGDAYTRAVFAALAAPGRALAVVPCGVASEATLPAGAGLASSAAYEVALLRALREAYELPLDDLELARVAWEAETEHVGVPCGLMDQLAASLGTPGAGLLIDCRSLEMVEVPIPGTVTVVVRDSGVRHAHETGGYRERRAECTRAAGLLGVRALRDVARDDPRIDALPAPLDRRVRHVVEENARVERFAAALRDGDAAEAGRIMLASHASQRDLFEVSVPEVDALVEALVRDGAHGARLTGGGFGGCVVALVPPGWPDS